MFTFDDHRERVEEYLPGLESRSGAHLINKVGSTRGPRSDNLAGREWPGGLGRAVFLFYKPRVVGATRLGSRGVLYRIEERFGLIHLLYRMNDSNQIWRTHCI